MNDKKPTISHDIDTAKRLSCFHNDMWSWNTVDLAKGVMVRLAAEVERLTAMVKEQS